MWGHWDTQGSELVMSARTPAPAVAPATALELEPSRATSPAVAPATALELDPLDAPGVWAAVDEHMASIAKKEAAEIHEHVSRLRERELQLDDEEDALELKKLDMRDRLENMKGWENRLFVRERALVCQPRPGLLGGRRVR